VILLAIDGVTEQAGIAVSRDDEIVLERSWEAGRNTAIEVPPAISEAMSAAGIAFSDLDAVVVGLGPGSYTGIRISVALAKGISVATGCDIIGVSTLEQIAFASASWTGPICAAMPVGADQIGIALFSGPSSDWTRVSDDTSYPRDALPALPSGTLVAGPASSALTRAGVIMASSEAGIPRPSCLLRIAMLAGRMHASGEVVPNYLRLSTPEERLRAVS
jgi:tRNA threonylcarbamoyladenosine biosynthesis protein TsaB